MRIASSIHLGLGYTGTFDDAAAQFEQDLLRALPKKVEERATELGSTHVLYLDDVQSRAGRGTECDSVDGSAMVNVLFLKPLNT